MAIDAWTLPPLSPLAMICDSNRRPAGPQIDPIVAFSGLIQTCHSVIGTPSLALYSLLMPAQ